MKKLSPTAKYSVPVMKVAKFATKPPKAIKLSPSQASAIRMKANRMVGK